jgi:hypothetical protein
MPRQRDQVDWYVEMSERLERRQARRKWVILCICVAVPLALMAGGVLFVVGRNRGWWSGIRRLVMPAETPKPVKEQILEAKSVEIFWKGDIKFPRLDGAGMVTTELHFFREMLPEGAKVFTVRPDSEERGTIVAYRLKQVATGEVYSFEDVEAKKIAGEWTITEQGWSKIKGELQAKLRVSLGGPIN